MPNIKNQPAPNERRSYASFLRPKLKPRSDLGNPWLVIFITLFIFLLSQFIAAVIVAIAMNFIDPGASLSDLLDQSSGAQFVYVLIAEGLAVLSVIYIVRRWCGLSLAIIGLGRRPKLGDAGRALLGGAVYYLILIGVSSLIALLAPSINTDEAQNVGFNSLNTTLDGLLAFVALVILPPIGEETLIRGYLYSGLRARWRFVVAMLVTSLLFGLAHLGSGAQGGALWIAGIDTFILSVVLVFLREKTGALYAPMLLHALNNLIAFGIHFHV